MLYKKKVFPDSHPIYISQEKGKMKEKKNPPSRLAVFLSLCRQETFFFLMDAIRPHLNKKSFPVERPGGIILRLYPAAFFFLN